MSKRSSLPARSMMIRLSVILLLFVLLIAETATLSAQTSNPYIWIVGKSSVSLGSVVDVSVELYQDTVSAHSFGAFDLLITYDPQALTSLGVFEGGLLDSSGWESFESQQGQLLPGIQAVRLHAVADLDNGAHHPNSYLWGKSGRLATLRFQLTSDSAYMWNNVTRLYCLWNDCSDNTFVTAGNDTLLFSQDVWDWYGGPFPYPSHLGTRYGAPDSCLAVPDVRVHLRGLTFVPGSIATWVPDTLDTRGDLNLNGISYEIADMVMFSNYFLHGLSAFPNIGREDALAASDINVDGLILGFNDLVYMWRIIVGDVVPYQPAPIGFGPDAYFVQDTTNHRVDVTYNGRLEGAALIFSGNITPTFSIPLGQFQEFSTDSGVTRILILGGHGINYGSGTWFTYTGEGTLAAVMTSDTTGLLQTPTHLSGAGIACGDADGTSWIDISDAVYLLSYVFAGGPPPLDSHGGDVNCDVTADISDIVNVIGFIFGTTSAPCANCR